MNISQLPIVQTEGAITWRAGQGFVTATVGEKTVMYKGQWPVDAGRYKAARARLAQDYPELTTQIIGAL